MRPTFRLIIAALFVCATGAGFAVADELPSADLPIEQVIDQLVNGSLTKEKVTPAPQADDLNVLRRLMLDLAGRIPTTVEAKNYAANSSPSKRIELVDRLLASPDFAFHHRNELDRMLLANRPNNGDFRKYLLWATQQNRPWDAMFRDMLLADEADADRKAALEFLKSRVKDVDDVTNDTAILFFGVNVTCAKCHDHPLTPDWQQDHFYGMSSFFSRMYLTKKNVLAEKPYGEVKFSTKAAEDKQAKFMFLTGAVIDEPAVERSKDEIKQIDELIKKQMRDDDAPAPQKPSFSPREKFVEVALRGEDNRFFARNIANRLWARMFGRGLVDPLDQMHSANPPSHPELLDWLARDLIAHNYDLKRLLRGIALSQTYSRSSEWLTPGDPPPPSLFAFAKVKPLTPRQYALSLAMATGNPTQWPTPEQNDQWVTRRQQLEDASNGWAGQFEVPGENFQIAVDEALLFSNNKRVEDDFLRDSNDRLVGHLKSLPDDNAVIDAACWAVFSRPARDDEKQVFTSYLQKRSSDRTVALRQVVWALITSPELRFSF